MRPTVLFLLLVLIAFPARASDPQVDLGSGLSIPLESGFRDAYSVGWSANLGASIQMAPRVRAFLDLGLVRNDGREYQPDPTFELPDAEARQLIVTLGVRGLWLGEVDQPSRIWGGLGWQTLATRWRMPFSDHEDHATVGLVGELRPEFDLSERWRVWIRQRISILGSITPESRSVRNLSASTIELGLSWGEGPR